MIRRIFKLMHKQACKKGFKKIMIILPKFKCMVAHDKDSTTFSFLDSQLGLACEKQICIFLNKEKLGFDFLSPSLIFQMLIL